MTGLETVRSHHLATAGTRADAIVRGARVQAEQIIASANAAAAELTVQAENEGAEAAQLDTGRDWTAALRRSRSIALDAQRGVYDEMKAAVAEAVRVDPRYADLLEHVAEGMQRRLGPGTEITESEGARAISATRKHRHIEWSLEAAAGECLAELGHDVEELWR